MKYIKRSISFLLALVMVAGLFPAVPFTVSAEARDSEHFSQDGDTYTIHDAAGWDLFCDLLAEGETFAGKTVQLDADVGTAAAPVTRMAGVIGDNAVPFCGVFDGGGYTLYFSNTAVDDNYIAPFRYVAGSSAAHACIHDPTPGSSTCPPPASP